MIICAVCHTQNSHLAITCKQCRGFLQTRIENLDLFSIGWKTIERPRKAFHSIAVAQHKNYSLLLAGTAGIAMVFLLFWMIKAGEYSASLINILVAGFSTGPVFGLLVVLAFSVSMRLLSYFSEVRVSLSQLYAVSSYALVPIVASVVLILPIEVMTFGVYFFTKNPSPFMLKPLSYIILLGLDGIFAAWTLVLLFVGMKTMYNESWLATGVRVVISLVVVSGAVALAVSHFVPHG